MTALFESLSLMVTLDVSSALILTILCYSQVRRLILDSIVLSKGSCSERFGSTGGPGGHSESLSCAWFIPEHVSIPLGLG